MPKSSKKKSKRKRERRESGEGPGGSGGDAVGDAENNGAKEEDPPENDVGDDGANDNEPKSGKKDSKKKKRKRRDAGEGPGQGDGAVGSAENNPWMAKEEEAKEEDPPENDASDDGVNDKGSSDISNSNKNNENGNDDQGDEDDNGIITKTPFSAFDLHPTLLSSIASLKWEFASRIQAQAIVPALEGRDVIGLAETGSGKTGAFSIPILNALLEKPQRSVFAVVLAPTRELAFQIHEVVVALGRGMGANAVCVVGGVDSASQAIALARNPHVVVATPGRLLDHLQNTKGFHLRQLKYLVLDEADRMLSMDFEREINEILEVIPDRGTGGRRTMLFSATMTSKVEKLQRASLVDPVRVEVSTKFQTPKRLLQSYLFVPAKYKDCYLTYLINEHAGQSILVFGATCNNVQRLALMLRNLGFPAICLHGQMSQPKRLGALAKFKAGGRDVLICTDVASRGLDIPSVDVVMNFDLPGHGKDYVHRVGRTARAGRSGKAIALVTQYDVEVYQRLEHLLGRRLPAYDAAPEEEVLLLLERVNEAQRLATREVKEQLAARGNRRRRGRGRDDDDGDGEEAAARSEMKRGFYAGGSGGRGGGYHNQRGGGNAKKKKKYR